jgi:hypothetical protein
LFYRFYRYFQKILVAKSKSDSTSSSSMEQMNKVLLAKKEVSHVTQIFADSTGSRRNRSCGSHGVSARKCVYAGA